MRQVVFVSCMVLLIQVVLWMPSLARTAEKTVAIPQGTRIGPLGSQLDKGREQRIVSLLQSLGKTLILERTRGKKKETGQEEKRVKSGVEKSTLSCRREAAPEETNYLTPDLTPRPFLPGLDQQPQKQYVSNNCREHCRGNPEFYNDNSWDQPERNHCPISAEQ